jgi:hypothetical protein
MVIQIPIKDPQQSRVCRITVTTAIRVLCVV